jgi:hypothetical protein
MKPTKRIAKKLFRVDEIVQMQARGAGSHDHQCVPLFMNVCYFYQVSGTIQVEAEWEREPLDPPIPKTSDSTQRKR